MYGDAITLVPDYTLPYGKVFTDRNDIPELSSGDRVYRIHTTGADDTTLFAVRPADSRFIVTTDADFEERVKSSLREKYGKAGWYMLDGLEELGEL